MILIEEFFRYGSYVILAAFLVYGTARLISTAYYKSKKDYEKDKTSGEE